MSLIDLDATTSARRVRTLVTVVGSLGVMKAGLLATELSLAGRLTGGADATVVVVALLVALIGAGSLALARRRRTRTAALVVAATSFALMIQLPGTASHHFYLLTLVILIVAGWTDADTEGASVDGDRAVPGWPMVLLRCQLSIVYGFTALSKLNSDFVSGTVAYRLAAAGLVAVPLPAPLARSAGFWSTVSIALVVIEASLAVLVWLPRWRRWTLAVAVPMHLIMTVFASSDLQTLAEIAVFTSVVLVLYAAFAPDRPVTPAAVLPVFDRPGGTSVSDGWLPWPTWLITHGSRTTDATPRSSWPRSTPTTPPTSTGGGARRSASSTTSATTSTRS